MTRAAILLLTSVLAFARACDANAPEPAAAAATAGPTFRLEEFARGLRSPVFVTHDGTERTFIVEQPGRIRLAQGGRIRKTPYLDIVKKVRSGGECGLLSVAFHPDFATNGYLYVNYTADKPLRTVVAEYQADPKAETVDPTTERILLTIDQPFSNHNGGQNVFGPDGMLYIGTGDGGSANDPQNNGQKPGTLLGKVLRIDVNQREPYGIPKDNPFLDRPEYRPEIWATGLRNPWRVSFDRKTGACFTGDVGQNKWEEIDLLVSGGNYGWREREAAHPFQPTRGKTTEFVDPIAEYGRELGGSVTGGYVYRGKRVPALDGTYVYADYVSGRFWGLRYADGKVLGNNALNVVLPNGNATLNRVQPSSFGEDVNGELYVCDHNGVVYRIAAP